MRGRLGLVDHAVHRAGLADLLDIAQGLLLDGGEAAGDVALGRLRIRQVAGLVALDHFLLAIEHEHELRASKAAREYVQWASEKQRERCGISELWVSTKCGESDTTSGCGSNPTVGNAFDKLHPLGNYLCFGETTEITGGEHIVAARCANDAVREK
jgi:altronate dehydratase